MSSLFLSGATSCLLNSHRFSPQIDPAWERDAFFPPAVLEMGRDTCYRSHSQKAVYLVSQAVDCPKNNQRSGQSPANILQDIKENVCSQAELQKLMLAQGLPEIWASGTQVIVFRKLNMLCSFSCFYITFGDAEAGFTGSKHFVMMFY